MTGHYHQLPALLLSDNEPSQATLVISPLISLMKDQVDSLFSKKIFTATFINSQLDDDQKRKRFQAYLKGYYNILFIAPEALSTRRLGYFLEARPPALVVIDEAHCVSQWGHDFRPDYLRIAVNLRKIAGLEEIEASDWSTVAVTATARHDTIHDLGSTVLDIKNHLELGKLREFRSYSSTTQRPELMYTARHSTNAMEEVVRYFQNLTEEIKTALRSFPRQSNMFWSDVDKWLTGNDHDWPYRQKYLIYCQTKKEIRELVNALRTHLSNTHFKIEEYHADLTAKDRARIQDAFKNPVGGLNLIVATTAFGMGIDVPNIRSVVHMGSPATIEDYYQQAGRAGRDKQPAICCLIFNQEDFAVKLKHLMKSEPVGLLAFKTWHIIQKFYLDKKAANDEYKAITFPSYHLAAQLEMAAENLESEIQNIFTLLSECRFDGKSLIRGKLTPIPMVYRIRNADCVEYEICQEKEVSFLLADGTSILTQSIRNIAKKISEIAPIDIKHPLSIKVDKRIVSGNLSKLHRWLNNKIKKTLINVPGDIISNENLQQLFSNKQESQTKLTERMNALHEWMLAHATNIGETFSLRFSYKSQEKNAGLNIKARTADQGIRKYIEFIDAVTKQIESLKSVIELIPEDRPIDLFELICLIQKNENLSYLSNSNMNSLESLIRLLQRFDIVEVDDFATTSDIYTAEILVLGRTDILDIIENAEHVKTKKNLDYFKLDCLSHYATQLNTNPSFDAQMFFEDYFSGRLSTSSMVELILNKSPIISDRSTWTSIQREVCSTTDIILVKSKYFGTGRRTTLALKIANKIKDNPSILGRYIVLLRNKMDGYEDKIRIRLEHYLGIYADGVHLTDIWKLCRKITANNIANYTGLANEIKIIEGEDKFANFMLLRKDKQNYGYISSGQFYWDFSRSMNVSEAEIRQMVIDFINSCNYSYTQNDNLAMATLLVLHEPTVIEGIRWDFGSYSIVTETSGPGSYLNQFLRALYCKLQAVGVSPDLILEYSPSNQINQRDGAHPVFGNIRSLCADDMLLVQGPFLTSRKKDFICKPTKNPIITDISILDLLAEIRAKQVDFAKRKILIQPSVLKLLQDQYQVSRFWESSQNHFNTFKMAARCAMAYFSDTESLRSLKGTLIDNYEEWQNFSMDINKYNDLRILLGKYSLNYQYSELLNSDKLYIINQDIKSSPLSEINWVVSCQLCLPSRN